MGSTEFAERRQYLSFSLAGTDYGVGILQVKEILQYETVTPVPSMPASVRGVINLRGSVVPIVDLAVKFGLPATPVTRRTCILVVEVALDGLATVMGMVADSVSEVLELAQSDIEPPPAFGTRIRADFLLGMGKVGRGFVLLLDLDRVLSAGERELLASIDSTAGAEPPAAAATESELPATPLTPSQAPAAGAP